MILRITLELKREVENPRDAVRLGEVAMDALQKQGWYVHPRADFELHGQIHRPE